MTLPFDLSQNPFQILGTRVDTTADEIVEQCQEGVFEGRLGEAAAAQVQQLLIPPRSRLEAEIGWFADEPPEAAAARIRAVIDGDFLQAMTAAEGAAPLAKTNAAAHLAGRFMARTEPLKLLIEAWDRIEPEVVFRSLVASRQRAQSPIPDRAHFDEALRKLQGLHARQAVTSLQADNSVGKTLTALVDSALKSGSPGPFLSTVVKDYDRATEPQLTIVRESIDAQIKRVRDMPSEAGKAVEQLAGLLNDWDAINQPVQLLEQAAGHEEPRSHAVCVELRKLAIWLANDKLLHREALALTKALLDTFPELDSVAAQLRKDRDTLATIVARLPAPPRRAQKAQPGARGVSAQPQSTQAAKYPTSGSTSGFRWSLVWFWAAVVGVSWILLASLTSSPHRPAASAPALTARLPPPAPPTPPARVAPPAQPAPVARPTTTASPAPVAVAPREVAPPVNPGRALSTEELRYCEFQGARLDNLRPLINRSRDHEIDQFNQLINDWNSRCLRFSYRPGALVPIQNEARQRSQQLHAQAEAILARWRAGREFGQIVYDSQPFAPARRSPAEPLLSLGNTDDARRIQRALQREGLYGGALDGQFGPQSRAALGEYQRRYSLPGGGEWNLETQRRLLAQ